MIIYIKMYQRLSILVYHCLKKLHVIFCW